MEKEEILEKAKKKAVVGEMEKQKINSGNWIALICAGVLGVALMIVEGATGHKEGVFAIASIFFLWASIFYTVQYFKAKRPKAVLIGSVLAGLGFIAMLTLYILTLCKVI